MSRYSIRHLFLENIERHKDIEYLVVALGDSDPRVEELCEEKGVTYKFVYHKFSTFQIGKCMNIGAQFLNTEFFLKRL